MTANTDMFDTMSTARTEPPRSDAGRALLVRRVTTAACLPGLFVLMAVAAVVSPLAETADSATMLDEASGHAGAVSVLAWMEFAGAVLTVAGVLGVVGLVRGRGAGWANAAGVLGVLSGLGSMAIACNHWLVVGLTRSGLPPATGARVLDAFHAAGGPVILLVLTPMAFTLAAVAAWRAGLAPRAVMVLGVLLALVSTAPSELGEYAAIVVGLVLTVWISLGVLRRR